MRVYMCVGVFVFGLRIRMLACVRWCALIGFSMCADGCACLCAGMCSVCALMCVAAFALVHVLVCAWVVCRCWCAPAGVCCA